MLAIDELPTIEELQDFTDSVDTYPVSAGALVKLATAEGAGRRVIDFYRSFPEDQVFIDKDDLASRSEQVQIMSTEELEQPWEIQRSPQE